MKLALKGGKALRSEFFPAYNTIGDEEKNLVAEVLDSGVLSRFLGCWHDNFFGGPQVRELEKEWAEYFGVKHAVSVNSCTSGLYCAVGALGIEPGEEVIVSPYTMSASAVAPLIYGAVPVFADIEEDYFCISAEEVERLITPATKAVIAVDIFGQPYDSEGINAIARKHGIKVIEDCAQAPGASFRGRKAGTLGDIGVFSLNYHKHIHCGEGGVVVTDNDELADRLRLIRNHAESAVEGMGVNNIVNMVGFNFRMTEIEAAISRCQLRKLENLLEARIKNCEYIEKRLAEIPALSTCPVREGCRHSYYLHPFKYNKDFAEGISRNLFIEAVRAELKPIISRESEGVKLNCGYVKPLYMLPLFRNKTAFGSAGYPFSERVNYGPGLCPVTEKMHEKILFTHELMHPEMTRKDIDDFIDAFFKVWENKEELREDK